MPKVSVLMPAYNSAKYISVAIDSILNQTFTDFELIIINDGSTDNTAEIVHKYTDTRIKFIDNTQNQGLIAVLNQGLDLCAGEYIARMDSDDISMPERLAKQVAYMDANPDVCVVGAWIQMFGDKNKQIKYPESVKLFDLLIYGSQVAHPTSMLRTSVLRKNNIRYDSAYLHAEDYGLWATLAKYGKIHNLQQVLLKYRYHKSSVSVLHHQTQMQNANLVRKNILKPLLSNQADADKIVSLTTELNQYFYLFGFIPLIRRKQYSITKTKYYLFGKLPLVRVQNSKIYLFEFIEIGNIK
ncbi:MAG: glycosyltransferase family 2 protein [Muribaculaceae bacterium]|nr:glycosyltransferase family 2 protein [Muribaculaceae bacterium]